MLRITITKIKKAWSHSLALASKGRDVTKTFPGKFHKHLVVTTAQKSTTPGKDPDSHCEKCEQIIKYLFDSNSTPDDYKKLQETIGGKKKHQGSTIINDETKTQGTIGDIQKVYDPTIVSVQNNQDTFVNDAQIMHDSTDPKKLGKIVGKSSQNEDIVHLEETAEPKTSKTNVHKLQSSTAKQTEEQLAQKIEIIEEAPLVEAERPKIEGFNTTPRILGQSTNTNTNDSLRLSNKRINTEEIDEENMRRKIENLVRNIENSLATENNPHEKNDIVNFSKNESDQYDKSSGSSDKNNPDSIPKRGLRSSTSQIDARLVKGMEQLGVPGSSGAQINASNKSRQPVKNADIDLKALKLKSDTPKSFNDKQKVESVEKVHLTFQDIPNSTHVSHGYQTTLQGEVIRYTDENSSTKECEKAARADKDILEKRDVVKTDEEQLVSNTDQINNPNQSKVVTDQSQESHYPKMTPYGMWHPNFQPYYYHYNTNVYHGHGFPHQRHCWFNQNTEYQQIQKNGPNNETEDQKTSRESQIEQKKVSSFPDQKGPQTLTNQTGNPKLDQKFVETIEVKQTYKDFDEIPKPNNLKVLSLKPMFELAPKTPLPVTELRPILDDIQTSSSIVNNFNETLNSTNPKLTECIAVKPTYKDLNESLSNPTKEIKHHDLDTRFPSQNSLAFEYPLQPPFSLYGNFSHNQISVAAKQSAENDKPPKQFYHMQKLQQSQFSHNEPKSEEIHSKNGSHASSSSYNTSVERKTPILATEVKPIFDKTENLSEKHIGFTLEQDKHSTLSNEKAKTVLSPDTQTEINIEASNQPISHRLLQAKVLVNPSIKEPSPTLTEKTKGTASASTVPLPDIAEKVEKISYAEMLRIVRLRSRLEAAEQKKVQRTKGKCGTPKPPCPPPSPTCPPPPPPRPSPCPPPDPPCPRPCKTKPCPPACSPTKTPKKPCCKMISVCDSLKNVFAQVWDFGSARYPQIPLCNKKVCYCQIKSIDNSTKAVLKHEVAMQLQDWECQKHTTQIGLGQCYWKLETHILARSFEPWVPIPSWPIPKKVKKKKLVCPKEGCKHRPPPRYGAPCESPCYPGNPCIGFPSTFRKHFSAAEILEENMCVDGSESPNYIFIE